MKNHNQIYDNSFYTRISDWSLKSANIIVPLIIDYFHPKSVIDIGCGDGTWLSVFSQYGVVDILGVDGDYVEREVLKIPKERFISCNLNFPLSLNQRFDLTICLEVAEHLKENSSEILVDSIVSLSDIIVFSAAIPFQPGDNHINARWPEFWISLFAKRDYLPINSLKYRIWDHPDVSYFYKQNILVFVKSSILEKSEYISEEYEKYRMLPVSIVHPDLLVHLGKKLEKKFSRNLFARLKRASKHFGRMLSNIVKLRVASKAYHGAKSSD